MATYRVILAIKANDRLRLLAITTEGQLKVRQPDERIENLYTKLDDLI